jgi:hypothetical protein
MPKQDNIPVSTIIITCYRLSRVITIRDYGVTYEDL